MSKKRFMARDIRANPLPINRNAAVGAFAPLTGPFERPQGHGLHLDPLHAIRPLSLPLRNPNPGVTVVA